MQEANEWFQYMTRKSSLFQLNSRNHFPDFLVNLPFDPKFIYFYGLQVNRIGNTLNIHIQMAHANDAAYVSQFWRSITRKMEEFDFECDVCDLIISNNVKNELLSRKYVIFVSNSSHFKIQFDFSYESVDEILEQQKISLEGAVIGMVEEPKITPEGETIIVKNFELLMTDSATTDLEEKVCNLESIRALTFEELSIIMDDLVTCEKAGFRLRNPEELNDVKIWENNWLMDVYESPNLIDLVTSWNMRVKLAPESTSIPMILLTVPDTIVAPTYSDIHFVIFPRDQRYIWKIYWKKLTLTQRANAIHYLPGNRRAFARTTFSNGIPILSLLQSTQFEEKFLDGTIPKTCLDIANAEMEQDLQEFLEEDRKLNIVLFFPLKEHKKLAAACYNRNNFATARQFVECSREADGLSIPEDSIVQGESYFRLDVREFPIYVSNTNLEFILESESQFFIVNELHKLLQYTASQSIIDGTESFMSGDHCQDRSDKRVSAVFPINADSFQDAVQNMEGKLKRKRVE